MSAPSRCEFGAPTARAAPGEGRRVLREARRVNGPSVAESLCTRAFRGTDRLTMNCSRAEVKRFSATIGPFQRLTFRQYRVSHRSVISNEAPQLRETPNYANYATTFCCSSPSGYWLGSRFCLGICWMQFIDVRESRMRIPCFYHP